MKNATPKINTGIKPNVVNSTVVVDKGSSSTGVIFKIGIVIAAIVAIIFLIVGMILWLRTKPFKIYCIACEKEGWWYRCQDDTGEGTETCRIAKEVEDAIDTTMEVIKESLKKITDAMDVLKKVAFDYEIPYPPDFSLPRIDNIEIPNVFDIDCEFTVPVIKVTFNPCEQISSVLEDIVNGLNVAINESIEIINIFMERLEEIPNQLVAVLNNIIKNLRDFVQFIISLEFILLIQKNFIKTIENLEKYPLLLIEVMIHNTVKKIFPNITFGDTIFAVGFMITLVTVVSITGLFVFTYMILQLLIGLFI
jgi:hypothetical protein